MSGAKYGLFLGLLVFAMDSWAPQPAGWIAFWTALSVQIVLLLRIVWRRLRLPWFTAGGVAALLVCLAILSPREV